MSQYVFENLMSPENTDSGVADYVLIAPVYDFAANGIKCPVAPFEEPGDQVTVKTTHVFKDGRGFAKFLLAPEKNQLNAPTIGDLGFQKLDQGLEVFIAGSYAVAHEAVKNLINTPLIALSKDSNCNADLWYQLGCDCVYAYFKADFTTGTTREGVKGYKGTISYLNGFIQIYAGEVESLILADSEGSSE